MTVSSGLFMKHFERPIPPCTIVPVHLFVGHERRLLEVARSRHYTGMTLISKHACSKQVAGLEGRWHRSLAKRIISRSAIPIQAGPFFDTRFIEPNNISHMLMDIIPLCLHVQSAGGDVKFIFRPLQPRFRELLSYFGIEPLCTYRPIIGQQYMFRLSRQLAQYDFDHEIDIPFYNFTGEVYSPFIECRNNRKKIFLSRRGARSLRNESEVNSFLEDRGYHIFYPEEHSISEQISIMQSAEDVVAIHGAAMAFLALNDRIRTLVELLPPNVYHDHFPLALGHKVESYFQLVPSFDDNVQFAGWPAILKCKQQPFSVDIGQLRLALESAGN